jgi:hypothetical protein
MPATKFCSDSACRGSTTMRWDSALSIRINSNASKTVRRPFLGILSCVAARYCASGAF